MRLMVYEGTPEELSEVAALLSKSAVRGEAQERGSITALPPKSDGSKLFVSVKIARAVLTRIPLSKEQRKVLQAIYRAHPGRVAAPDLQDLIGYSTGQFAGLMGAFGRRLTHTKGYIEDTWFIDPEWNYDKGYNEYGLPETVREAMNIEGIS